MQAVPSSKEQQANRLSYIPIEKDTTLQHKQNISKYDLDSNYTARLKPSYQSFGMSPLLSSRGQIPAGRQNAAGADGEGNLHPKARSMAMTCCWERFPLKIDRTVAM